MKTIAIVIFDGFTDIDLFLMWDILGRNRVDWRVRIVGTKAEHRSAHGLAVRTHGHIDEANDADVVLFSSGKLGAKAALQDENFMRALSLDPTKQIIGSICAGAFILAALNLLQSGPATTHPDAKAELQALGVEVLDQPLVCKGSVATAGGCLSAVYLVGWVVEMLFDRKKRGETLRETNSCRSKRAIRPNNQLEHSRRDAPRSPFASSATFISGIPCDLAIATFDRENDMPFFFCRMNPPRSDFAHTMTDAERALMGEHAVYITGLQQEGSVVLFGRVDDPRGRWGLGILECADEAAARAIAANDPVVRSGKGFSYDIAPMLEARLRPAP
jgi:putative intracellular protease/amidase/uncharacterized protein YciI